MRAQASQSAAGIRAALALMAAFTMLGAGCDVTSAPSGSGLASTPTTAVDSGVADTPAATAPVKIDPALLAVLPRQVLSIAVQEDPDADSEALADDVLPTIAKAAVGFTAVDAEAQDLATGFVVKLLPGAMTDAIFRDWRDSYDEGACAGASEVIGHSETDIAGNHVYIGTCSTGLRTYHVWLKKRDLLISISSTGDRHLGLVMLENLRG